MLSYSAAGKITIILLMVQLLNHLAFGVRTWLQADEMMSVSNLGACPTGLCGSMVVSSITAAGIFATAAPASAIEGAGKHCYGPSG